ncbi:phosphate transport system regulatory protein PhoU [Planctomycetales bacterium]|nr:phosphate transport system regulatory protein PhoU [Planctomycetales bacterium]GHT37460.1 phosphate transport system regulatory protein PhoU [Planctomycetales bacterium]
MSELPKRLERLFLKLDRAALTVEQHLSDMLFAIDGGNLSDAEAIISGDEKINRREVEIERECIRLLALYQPAAGDLRKICFAIKVNNDLERIADNCVSSAKMMSILVKDDIDIKNFQTFHILSNLVVDAVHQTNQLISAKQDISLAHSIIKNDRLVVDKAFRNFLQEVFTEGSNPHCQIDSVYALTSIGRALERIGDLCTNIAEDTVFLLTGEIVRHTPNP